MMPPFLAKVIVTKIVFFDDDPHIFRPPEILYVTSLIGGFFSFFIPNAKIPPPEKWIFYSCEGTPKGGVTPTEEGGTTGGNSPIQEGVLQYHTVGVYNPTAGNGYPHHRRVYPIYTLYIQPNDCRMTTIPLSPGFHPCHPCTHHHHMITW